MTREQFDQLVREIERRYAGRASALARNTAFWALAGYAWFASTAAIVLLISGLCFLGGFKAGWDGIIFHIIGALVLLGGGSAVIRTLWIRVPAPEGSVIRTEQAPVLDACLKELRASLDSISFHKVMVVPDYNAAVVQTPRLGVFGWWQNHLLLGLPLMETLSEREFRAVLAHEFAHLSRSHARFSHWLYRLRRAWEQLFQNLRQPRPNEISFNVIQFKFVNWFWPRFNAHAFVLSRANEFEADALAAGVAGATVMKSALVRIDLQGRHLEKKFWPDFWQTAATQPCPPEDVLTRLVHSIRSLSESEEKETLAAEGLRELTTNADTHPCLTDRIRALDNAGSRRNPDGVNSDRDERSAAEVFLGSALVTVRADAGALWKKKWSEVWKERHARTNVIQHHLAVLDKAPSAADTDALWDKAWMKLQTEGPAVSEQLLREILTLDPRHANASQLLGRILIDRGDASGVALVEQSIEADEDLVQAGCQALFQHFRKTGQADRLHAVEARLDRHEAAVRESHVERSSVSGTDDFIPHELTAEELAALATTLSSVPDLSSARLARKALRHFPKQKLFVLQIAARKSWHQVGNQDRDDAIVVRLSQEVRLPGRVLVFSPHGSYRPIARKLAALPGSEIYRAPG